MTFSTLLYRYFFYDWLFRDASRGSAFERAAALRYNIEQSRWLPLYLKRWSVLALSFYAMGWTIEALGFFRAVPLLRAGLLADQRAGVYFGGDRCLLTPGPTTLEL